MTGNELKEILVNQGVVLSDLARLLGFENDQRLHSALRAADVRSGLIERIAKVLNKSVCSFYHDSSVAVSGVNVTNGGGLQRVGNINNVKSQDDAVAALVAQLSKKDEQIDRLLGLLEKIK